MEAEGHELLSEKYPNCCKTATEILKAWEDKGTQEKKADYKKRVEELNT